MTVITIRARYDGIAFWPIRSDLPLPRDRAVILRVEQPRSPAHHRLFFAVIAWAHKHWPETHEFEPSSEEHLRAWLLCKAGYRTTTHYSLSDIPEKRRDVVVQTVAAVIGQVLAGKEFAFVAPHRDGLAVHTPQSIRFEKLDEGKFLPISGKVFAVIGEVIGVDMEKVVQEIKRSEA